MELLKRNNGNPDRSLIHRRKTDIDVLPALNEGGALRHTGYAKNCLKNADLATFRVVVYIMAAIRR